MRGPIGQEREIQAVIDTGFDGSLTLSPALIAALGLPWRRRGCALLADGNESVFDIPHRNSHYRIRLSNTIRGQRPRRTGTFCTKITATERSTCPLLWRGAGADRTATPELLQL